ncbi:Sec34-like family-domain-containing protein [Lipomyces arxii]|uniref:Sec34-like family-domain-containing protein n=1 Tax=Lipomyces arxii TaxID=56418 RepID=UPI0034CF291F
MYDDWAYHVSPTQYAPQPQPKPRRRRKSILQDVALEHTQQDLRSGGQNGTSNALRDVAEEITNGRPQSTRQLPEYTVPLRRVSSTSGLLKLRKELALETMPDNIIKENRSLTTYPFTTKEELLLMQPIGDDIVFMDLYDSLEKELQDANESMFIKFRNEAQSQLESCELYLSQTDSTLATFDSLAAGFEAVRKQTSSFQEASDALSIEHKRLETLANDLDKNLQPFNMLEEITRRLNAPGTDFVKDEGFKKMLLTLDQCITYIESHPNFNGIDVYHMRFRQCMTRALTLIRTFFISSIRDVSTDVQSRIAARNFSEATQSALFYTKFRVDAPLLQSLTSEIASRCEGHEEYASLLGDCYKAFINVRRRLITPIVSKRVSDLRNSIPDLIQLTRQSIAYMRTLCMDEFNLFYAIFTEGEDVIYDLLDNLCEPLHDILRSRIIHEKKAEVLYELCSLLQGLSTRESEEMEDEYFDSPQLDFGRLFQSTLQDAQVKLVFRMQAYA